MKQANVFDWAEVKLAEEFLTVLLKSNVLKQHVAQLANAGGVSLTWDENGLVKLEGPWEHILKSQTVFENYLRSLEIGMESGEEKEIHEITTNQGSCMGMDPTKNVAEEENEVYVNITLSNAELSDLYHKSLQVVHISEDDMTNSDSCKYENTSETSCPKEVCVSRPNNLGRSKTEKLSPEQNKMLKMKENHDFNFQQEISFNNCNILARSTEKSTSEDAVVKSIYFSEEQNENNISSSNSDNGVVNPDNNSLLNENKPTHLTLVASKSNRKNVKKKDYEELAPFKFFCSVCSYKSKRKSHYTKHMKLHNGVSELFKCAQCTFSSIRLSHLRRHELSHSNNTLSCSVCQYRTNNQKLLVRHQQIKHSTKRVSEGDIKKDILYCVHCDYQTSRHCFLQRHMRIHAIDASSVRVYECEQCSYKTNYKEHFVRHTNNVHKGIRPFLCHWCGKAFKRQDALKQHSVMHATQAAVVCSHCGKDFKCQAHLSQHMSVHSSDRLFLCELCGACFKTRAVQRKHMITIHQHPKSFLCSHCSRKFSTKFALNRHNKQHSSVRPAERKNKHEQQASSSMIVSGRTSISKSETTDPTLFSEPIGLPASHQNTTFIGSSREGEKMTLQLTETYETEMVQVIPAQPILHCNNETTTLLYLTRTFSQM